MTTHDYARSPDFFYLTMIGDFCLALNVGFSPTRTPCQGGRLGAYYTYSPIHKNRAGAFDSDTILNYFIFVSTTTIDIEPMSFADKVPLV